MSVNYFDDYVWQTETTGYNFDPSTAFHAQGNTKGMMTGMLSRNIETNDWLKIVNYFDYKGRLIQSWFKNHKGNIERSETQYRFNGEILKMRMEHEGVNEIYEYEYNHLGAKTTFKHTLNGTLKNVAVYDQDQIGRLKTKKLSPTNDIGTQSSGEWNNTNVWLNNVVPSVNDHVFINESHTITIPNGQAGSAGSLFLGGILHNYGALKLGNLPSTFGASDLQTVDYSYHIRGLRGINLDGNNNPSLTEGKLFSFKLGYEDSGFWDGNIGSQTWLSAVDNLSRSYFYSYDGANRLLGANFSGGKPNENYSLDNMSYDFNGNIKNLWRKGMTQNNTFDYTDKLSYTYANNSNKLSSVSDAINGNLNTGDFRDGNTSDNDYEYWLDGSLKKDLNKGISLIEYNYLKLHRKITFSDGRTINFQYDASGNKLQETASNGMVTGYFGSLIFKNNVLYQIAHDEGRIVNGYYEYNIIDHLGNLRMSFKDSLGIAKIIQAQDYEPFGLENWTSKFVNNSKISNYKFNGIEKQEEANIYLAKFRGLDSQIGRWTQIDPKPDLSMSLYSSMNNNPIRNADPLGDTVIVNKVGYVIRNDKKDNFVFMQGDKGKITSLGELGKKIDISKIFKNLLKTNIKVASNTASPFSFYDIVKTNGEWDLKANMKTIYGIGNDGKTQFTFGKQTMEAQDLGNYHFGAVAKAFGFPEEFTLNQAGVYQIKSKTSRPEWQPFKMTLSGAGYGGTYYAKELLPPYGDDPRDQGWIKEGFKYYNDNKNEKDEK